VLQLHAAAEASQRRAAALHGLHVAVEPEELCLRRCIEERRGVTAAAERAVDQEGRRQAGRPADQRVHDLAQQHGRVRAHGIASSGLPPMSRVAAKTPRSRSAAASASVAW
jgi:hypothetical protein